MAQWYMITAPRGKYEPCESFWYDDNGVPQTIYEPKTKGHPKKVWKLMIEDNDIHDWIIAMEEGKHGYKHWQIRVRVGAVGDFCSFDRESKAISEGCYVGRNLGGIHIEESSDASGGYERKEGVFWCSEDTNSVRSVRFGTLTPAQRDMLRKIDAQNDRQVTVFYDSSGSHGKSWLCVHLWEKGRAVLVPRYACSARGINQFVCSVWKQEPYIFIDIPRAGDIPDDLYEAIEALKDGVVYDERYSGRARNIRGTKVAVFTNTLLDQKQLSEDRWVIHGTKQYPKEKPRAKPRKDGDGAFS